MSRKRKSPLIDPELSSLTKGVPTPAKEMGDFNKLLFLSLFSALRSNCECQTCKRLRKAADVYEKLVEGL